MGRRRAEDVYAAPGRLNDPLSYGCNRLIDQGAFVLYDINRFVEDVLERCNYIKKRNASTVKNMLTNCEYENKSDKAVFGGLEAKILEILDIQYVSAGDVLCALEDCTASEVLAALSTLECCGKVESEGSFYRKII